MIRRYNQSQTIKAVLFAFGGLISCWLAYLFFRYLPVFLAWQFGYSLPTVVPVCTGLVGVAAAWVSGYRMWKSRGGLFSYHESWLYHDLGDDTAGAFITDFYAHRVTGPAYILGQLFMAGPQWTLKACSLLQSRISHSPELELKLEDTLAVLRKAKRWQGLSEYPNAKREILLLAQMGLIDFSAHKGVPRFKVR